MHKDTKSNNLKPNGQKEIRKTEKQIKFNSLFDSEWEVFVIKKDKLTGKFVGKTACCALSPV